MGLFVSTVQALSLVLSSALDNDWCSVSHASWALSTNVFYCIYLVILFKNTCILRLQVSTKSDAIIKSRKKSVHTPAGKTLHCTWSGWQIHHCLKLLWHYDSYSPHVPVEHLKCVASQCELRCAVSIYAYKYLLWAIIMKKMYNIISFHIDSPLKYYFGCIGLNKIH